MELKTLSLLNSLLLQIMFYIPQLGSRTEAALPLIIQEPVPEVEPILVRRNAGSTLILPCDVTPPKGDKVALILWYRDFQKEAIYTYDTRNTSDRGVHGTSIDPSFRERASFFPKPPANLTLHHARDSDAGLYQCRVDFLLASSKTTYVQVRILAPSKSLHLEDSNGVMIGDILTADLEKDITLFCVVLGGDPRPYIMWTVNGETSEGSKIIIRGMRTETSLVLRNLTRRNHHTEIGCQAAPPNSSIILADKTVLKINTPPLKVWLERITSPLVADRLYRFSCGVSGAYPIPSINWEIIRGGKTTSEALGKELLTGVSGDLHWVEYRPRWTDNWAQLNCSVHSRVFPNNHFEESVTLKVHYAPRMRILLGKHLGPSSIREEMDVYFQCSINANPQVYKVSWFHGEEEILNDSNKGILVANEHLVIQKITRKWTGHFTCRASNVVGDSISNKLNITIQFAPICAEGGLGVFEAALGEEVYLPCRVLAFPSNVSFYWTFANTVMQERLPQDVVRSNGLESVLRYRLETPQDYGTLQCWAINIAGEQNEACTVTLKPAGAPAPPNNCSVSNQTWDSLEISCFLPKIHRGSVFEEGSETQEIFEKFGNFTQKAFKRLWREPLNIRFLLTIYEQETLIMVHNETGMSGIFLIRELSPGLDYLITISRFNERGRSSEITLEAFTLKTAENRMRDETVKKSEPIPLTQFDSSLTVAVAGGGIVILALVLAFSIVLKKKCQRHLEGQPKARVSLSSLGDPPDLLEKEIGDYSPTNTTKTHSPLTHEVSTSKEEASVGVVSSLRSTSVLPPPISEVMPSTPASHQILLISQLPPPPESFMTSPLPVHQATLGVEIGPPRKLCQCVKNAPESANSLTLDHPQGSFTSSVNPTEHL